MRDKIAEILESLSETMRALAATIICPKCKQKVSGDKFNLGPKYSSFEGCKKCADEESG